MTEDTKTTTSEPAKRGAPAWQNDPDKKAAAAAKAVATRAANKAKKQAQDAKRAERKAARDAAPVNGTTTTAADATSDDFLTRVRGQFAVKLADADAGIEELSQTLQSAETAAQDARDELAIATAARELIASKLAALEKVSA